MKCIRLFLPAIAVLLLSTGAAPARVVRPWPYQELLNKSDLTVIATPTATKDTKEHGDHPERAGQPVIGLETRLSVSVVLKGDKELKDFTLHHYRADKMQVPNAPTFVSFNPTEKRMYILFLVRETDGRYAPVAGQTDPGLAIRELISAGAVQPAVEASRDEVVTKKLEVPGYVTHTASDPGGEEAWMPFTKPIELSRYALTNETVTHPILVTILRYASPQEAKRALQASWRGRPQGPEDMKADHWDGAHQWQRPGITTPEREVDVGLLKGNYFVGVYNLSSDLSTKKRTRLLDALAENIAKAEFQ